ncbi:carboxylesterase family protein [Inquilinus sp. CA228]|uniref:carboxylesterase family protein n=1 Tax=Inquilinus sp. CA228 TaxID=3455609 RepID=UPI003F8D785D
MSTCRVAVLATLMVALSLSLGGPAAAGPALSACPANPPVTPAPPGAVILSSTVAPSDTSTSIVLTPDVDDQIRCGRVAVDARAGVVYSRPTLPSGVAKALAMDILTPRYPGRKPLVIYVSGGGFVQSTKEAALDQRSFVAEAGFVVASIQYRILLDGATYRDTVADVKAAVRYLRAHAGEYGIDPGRVGLWGESAGGYLVAMAGVTNGQPQFEQGGNLDQSSRVQAVVDKFGSSNMARIAADFDLATRQYYASPGIPIALYVNGSSSTQSLQGDPTAATTANPLTYASFGDPAFLLLHGSADNLISPSQTLILHQALRAAGLRSTRLVLAGARHGDLSFIGDPVAGLPWTTNEVMGDIVAFLRWSLARDGFGPFGWRSAGRR